MLGKTESWRTRGWQRMSRWRASLTHWTWVWVSSMSWQWKRSLACCSPCGCKVDHDWATELNWPCSDQQVRSYHLRRPERNFAFREKITKGKLKWGKDERFRRALLKVQGYLNTQFPIAEMRSRTWRLTAALFLMCSRHHEPKGVSFQFALSIIIPHRES